MAKPRRVPDLGILTLALGLYCAEQLSLHTLCGILFWMSLSQILRLELQDRLLDDKEDLRTRLREVNQHLRETLAASQEYIDVIDRVLLPTPPLPFRSKKELS